MDESTTKDFSGGFAASVQTESNVDVREAGALAIVAGGDATITQGGAGICVIGGDVTMNQAGVGKMLAGGRVEVTEGGVGQLLALEAEVTDSRVVMVIGGKVTLERSEVMLTTAQAAALGAAAGAVLFLLSRLFRRS